jgi:TPR repeat protein
MPKYSIYYASSLIVLGFLFVISLPALADMRSVPIAELILQAKHGNPEAQDELGLRYCFGIDVDKDYVQSAKWYLSAAEQGHAKAQNEIGGFYEKGTGVPRDQRRAVYWYEKAAAQGYAPAQYNLALKLDSGDGVERDALRSTIWLRRAAESGMAPQAEYNLGVRYLNGVGVKKDLHEASAWFRKSADHGFPLAMSNLATCYLRGEGVNKDLVHAYKWLYLATGGGAQQRLISEKDEMQARIKHSDTTYWLYALEGEDLRKAKEGLKLLRDFMTERQVSAAKQQADAWNPK